MNSKTYAKLRAFLSTPSGWRATTYLLRNRWKIIVFLSTPSGWRATKDIVDANNAQLISIHALRVEGDY